MTLMSWILVGLRSISARVIPGPFNWKVPSVSPRASISNVFLSSTRIFSSVRVSPSIFFNRSKVSAMVARFLMPKRSNLRSPTVISPPAFGSREYMSYCVMIFCPPLVSYWSGVYSVSSLGDMTTPAACTETCLTLPSIFCAISTIVLVSASLS